MALKPTTKKLLRVARLHRNLDLPRSQKVLRKSIAENVRYRRKTLGRAEHTKRVIRSLPS